MNVISTRQRIKPSSNLTGRLCRNNGAVDSSQTIDWFATLADKENRDDLTQLRFRTRRGATPVLTMVLLDTSGSQMARGAMAHAKGAIAGLCQQAYRQRRPLELIGFSGNDVVTLQASKRPPCDDAALLDGLGAGGGTPLRKALQHAAKRLHQLARQQPTAHRIVYIFTDARCRDEIRGIVFDAEVHVVDTEQTPVRLGKARVLASALNASYRHIDSLPLA